MNFLTIPHSVLADRPTRQQSEYATIECIVDRKCVNCIIMTGIQRSLIDSATFNMSGRRVEDAVKVKDSPNTFMEVVPLAEEVSISSGDVLVSLPHLGVSDLSRLRSISGVEFEMVLGNDFLEKVVLNLTPEQIWVSDQFQQHPDDFDSIPLKFRNNHPILPLSIAGLGIREFEIYTGRNETLSITESTSEKLRELNLVTDRNHGWTHSVEGVRDDQSVICANASIGSLTVSNLPVSIGVSNSVGMGLLKHMHISIDGRNQLIYLQSEPHGKIDWFPRNDSGLLFNFPETSRLRILNVIPDSPSSIAGLEANDEVLLIENKSPRELTVDSVRNYLSQSKSPVRIVYLRNGQRYETELKIPKTYEYPPKWDKSPEEKAREFFEQQK